MIKTSGIEEEIRKTAALASDIDKSLKTELDALGMSWRDDARRNSLVKTGTLRRNYNFEGVEKSNGEYRLEVYNNIEYAPHVEYGHRIVVYGHWTGRVKRGEYTLTNARQRAYAKLPKAIRRAMQKVEERFND